MDLDAALETAKAAAHAAEQEALIWKLVSGAAGGIAIAVTAVWRALAAKTASLETNLKSQAELERSDCQKERQEWSTERTRLLQERDQERARASTAEKAANDELRARVAEQALFLQVLRSKQSKSSEPPQK